MKCRFCNNEKKLVDAHIIPKALCMRLRGEDGKAAFFFSDTFDYKKKLQIGPYDRSILCRDCEDLFGPIDEYGIDFCKGFEDKADPIHDGREIAGWVVKDVDPNMLSLFVVSMLWRASVSTLGMFHRIDLGPYLDRVKEMILHGGSYSVFPVVVRKYEDELGNGIIMDPYPTRVAGIRCYSFSVPGFEFVAKFDQREFSSDLQAVFGSDFLVYSKIFTETKDFQIARQMVMNSQ